jgi:hypothetical protein
LNNERPADRRRMMILTVGLAALLLTGMLALGTFGKRIDADPTRVAGTKGTVSERRMIERRRGAVAQAATIAGNTR